MEPRRNARIVAACACIAVGIVASALLRRAGSVQTPADPSRAAFLEARRARMRDARVELLASGSTTAA
jgi:hypothetical protein